MLNVFGLDLRGNCALQPVELENSVGDTLPRYESDMFIFEESCSNVRTLISEKTQTFHLDQK